MLADAPRRCRRIGAKRTPRRFSRAIYAHSERDRRLAPIATVRRRPSTVPPPTARRRSSPRSRVSSRGHRQPVRPVRARRRSALLAGLRRERAVRRDRHLRRRCVSATAREWPSTPASLARRTRTPHVTSTRPASVRLWLPAAEGRDAAAGVAGPGLRTVRGAQPHARSAVRIRLLQSAGARVGHLTVGSPDANARAAIGGLREVRGNRRRSRRRPPTKPMSRSQARITDVRVQGDARRLHRHAERSSRPCGSRTSTAARASSPQRSPTATCARHGPVCGHRRQRGRDLFGEHNLRRDRPRHGLGVAGASIWELGPRARVRRRRRRQRLSASPTPCSRRRASSFRRPQAPIRVGLADHGLRATGRRLRGYVRCGWSAADAAHAPRQRGQQRRGRARPRAPPRRPTARPARRSPARAAGPRCRAAACG